jgi:hypothetical protein
MKTVQLRRPVRHIDIRYVRISEPIIDTLLPLTAVAVLVLQSHFQVRSLRR